MYLSTVLKTIAISVLLASAMPALSQTLPDSKAVLGSSAQAAAAGAASQPVQVKNAWVRAMVAGQQSTGAFMTVTARTATRLVAVASAVAGVAEVHEMKIDRDIMKMRAVPVLELPAGKSVQFKPGGFHVMLMDLKQPLTLGSTVPLTLFFKDEKGVESRLDLMLPVAVTAPGAAPASGKAAGVDPRVRFD